MAPISSPKPTGGNVTGGDYNDLREDVLAGHTHSGSRDGDVVDHTDLTSVGTRSHATIDTDIDSLETAVKFQAMVMDNFDEDTKTTGTGWTSAIGEWNGSEADTVTITFSPALPSVPIVTVTAKPGSYDENGNGNHDIMSPMGTFVGSETVNGFIAYFRRDDLSGYPNPRPLRMNFIALCP